MPRPRPARIDIAVAAGLAVWAVVEALLLDGDGSRPVRVLWALAVTLPLAWRRHHPVGVAFGVAALVVVRVLLDQAGTGEEGAMPFPALLVAAYSAAVHARTLGLAIAAGAERARSSRPSPRSRTSAPGSPVSCTTSSATRCR